VINSNLARRDLFRFTLPELSVRCIREADTVFAFGKKELLEL